MANPHQALGRFFDGELPESEVDGFRAHLATCRQCQAGLDELMQLDVLGTRHLQLQQMQRSRVVPIRRVVRPPWLRSAGIGLAAAAALVLVVKAPWSRPSPELWQPDKDGRLVEARSSYPQASQYRPVQKTLGTGTALPPPVQELGKLGDDHRGIAAAYLVRGDPGLVKTALAELQQATSPEADVDRAMAYLVRGDADLADPEAALQYAERALESLPAQPGPALWNKALALQALGLTMSAANTFDQVAQLGEPGWATEARSRATKLRGEATHVRESWQQAREAATSLVKGGTSLPEVALNAPITRRLFYDAVRTRSSSAEVAALLPLADQLDLRSGGTTLHDYVRWAAGRDFKVRGPDADKYRRLVVDDDVRVIPELSASREDDLALGAMTRLDPVLDEKALNALEAHVKNLKDPWFDVLLLQKRSEREEATNLRMAMKLLDDAIRIADASRLQYRSLYLRMKLITLQLRAAETEAARKEAMASRKLAEGMGDWGIQVQIIQQLGQLHRFLRNYVSGKAYFDEAIERTRDDHDREQELFGREQLALLAVEHLRFDQARKQMDAAIDTGLALSTAGIGVLADLARHHESSMDRQAIDRYRAALPGLPAGAQVLGMGNIGRWTLEVNPEEGRRLLNEVIRRVGKPSDPDGDLSRARAFAYSALILDAAKRKDFERALALFSEEAGVPFPATCAVAMSLNEERAAIVVRGPAGEVEGIYDGARTTPLPDTLRGFVPERLLARLNGCREVKVVARPPLFGRLEALPNTMAWSYLLLRPGAASPPGKTPEGKHLVVQSPALSHRVQALGLTVPPPIITDRPPEGFVVLEGAEATPDRIRSELQTAVDVDFVLHSAVNPYSGEASLLAAEGPGGDTVTATQVRANALAKQPTVMLSACHAAHSPPVLYEHRSLPAAFLLAGASAVFAADDDVPDREGPAFFEAIRAQIHKGIPPSVALRDVRQSWLATGQVKDWGNRVLLFE